MRKHPCSPPPPHALPLCLKQAIVLYFLKKKMESECLLIESSGGGFQKIYISITENVRLFLTEAILFSQQTRGSIFLTVLMLYFITLRHVLLDLDFICYLSVKSLE